MATAIMQGETLTGREQQEQIQETHERNLSALTARVRMIKAAKVDAVADTRALKAFAMASGDNHRAQVVLGTPQGLSVQIGDVAHDQLASLLKIDKRYYDRMNAEASPLLADNLNWWLQNAPAERLLRMLKPEGLDVDGRTQMASLGTSLRLRGVLGKGYRTIDDADLVDAILPQLLERGATLQEFSIDERRMHAAFYTPAKDIQELRLAYANENGLTIEQLDESMAVTTGRMLNPAFVQGRQVGEMIASGVTIRHSEVGFASLGASFVQKILKCLNRMVEESSISIIHRGGKNGSADEDVRFVSDTTQLLDNAALLSRVQDTIGEQFAPKKLVERSTRVLVAKTDAVALPSGKPLFEFVGNMGVNLGLSQTETELLKEETGRSVVEEGGPVRFAFIQGITAVARQMTDYDRRLEIERTGFSLLNDDAAAILKLGRDAERSARKRTN